MILPLSQSVLQLVQKSQLYKLVFLVAIVITFFYQHSLGNETGLASYYSNKLHGRKTASGQIYDRNKMTAAHRSLPFGTVIEVTNLSNQKKVIVKINDRGPFIKNRIVDLSYSAAKKLGIISKGIAKVSIRELKKNSEQ